MVRNGDGDVVAGCEDIVCQNVVLNLPAGRVRCVFDRTLNVFYRCNKLCVCVFFVSDFIGFALIIAMLMTYTIFLIPAREHIERIVLRCVLNSLNLPID